jgi:hypothetical protein
MAERPRRRHAEELIGARLLRTTLTCFTMVNASPAVVQSDRALASFWRLRSAKNTSQSSESRTSSDTHRQLCDKCRAQAIGQAYCGGVVSDPAPADVRAPSCARRSSMRCVSNETSQSEYLCRCEAPRIFVPGRMSHNPHVL